MLNTAPVTNVASRGRTLRLAFVSAVLSLVAAFAAVGSTIPLFNIYRAEDGFTNAGILAGMIGNITAIATGALALFIAATIVAGASQGIAISAATRSLLHDSTLADRAPIFSVIYLLSYSGATIPALIAGQLSNTLSLPQIALGYGALALIATLFTFIAAHNPRTDTTGTASA